MIILCSVISVVDFSAHLQQCTCWDLAGTTKEKNWNKRKQKEKVHLTVLVLYCTLHVHLYGFICV